MSYNVLDMIRSVAGVDCGALPLSLCEVKRPYLLSRAGLPTDRGTVCLMSIPYLVCEDAARQDRNLSLYAVPRDYHLYVKDLEGRLLPALRDAFPHHTFALYADHSPIMEVEAAAKAGLGLMGCNGLLITPKWGSFVFLAEVITDADWHTVTGKAENDLPTLPPKTCMECGKCLRACPAHCAKGDRSACLSALTQKKSVLTAEEEAVLASHPLVWGCDICQTVCPYNRTVIQKKNDTPIPFFREERLVRIDTAAVEGMSEEDFALRAYAWRGRETVLRNLRLKERKETP